MPALVRQGMPLGRLAEKTLDATGEIYLAADEDDRAKREKAPLAVQGFLVAATGHIWQPMPAHSSAAMSRMNPGRPGGSGRDWSRRPAVRRWSAGGFGSAAPSYEDQALPRAVGSVVRRQLPVNQWVSTEPLR
jgi:hypothetical protein